MQQTRDLVERVAKVDQSWWKAMESIVSPDLDIQRIRDDLVVPHGRSHDELRVSTRSKEDHEREFGRVGLR